MLDRRIGSRKLKVCNAQVFSKAYNVDSLTALWESIIGRIHHLVMNIIADGIQGVLNDRECIAGIVNL
jgi:hypothetical protein